MRKEHIFSMRIYSEDTDSFGIVHHANYLKFMERARTEWILQKGIRLDRLIQESVLFVVHRIKMDYLRPARVYDEIDINSTIIETHRVSKTYEQVIYAKKQPEEIYCRGHIVVVCVNDKMKPRRIPHELLEV